MPAPPHGPMPESSPIHWAKAVYRHPRGRIASDWHKQGDRFEWSLTIPANTTATAFVPANNQEAVT